MDYLRFVHRENKVVESRVAENIFVATQLKSAPLFLRLEGLMNVTHERALPSEIRAARRPDEFHSSELEFNGLE